MPASLAELGSGIAPPPGDDATGFLRGAEPSHTGRLAELRRWLAAVQGAQDAHEPRRARLLHLGGGCGCPDAAAELAQLSVREVPVTVVAAPDAVPSRRTPALSPVPEAQGAGDVADQLATGAALADAEVDTGTDLLVVSLPDADVLGPALIGVITGIEPVRLLPRGARLSIAEWTERAVAVRDARRALVGAAEDPDALLAAACRLAAEHADVAGSETCRVALACALLLHATARRTPVVLDGVGAAAAAALCAQAAPSAPSWWRAAELGGDPAYDAAINHLGVEPVLPVAVGGVGGIAGALAVLTLRMAVRAVRS